MNDWLSVAVQIYDSELCCDEESLAELLISYGAEGVEYSSPSNLVAYFQNHLLPKPEVLNGGLASFGCSVTEITQIKPRNWTQECFSLMTPTTIEALTIIPIQSIEEVLPSSIFEQSGATYPSSSQSKNTLFIIPGMGFGTGHHPATKMALELLQHNLIRSHKPKYAIDIGTGSGILAISAALLYGSHVEATDVDPSALDNARDNIKVNDLTDKINLSIATPIPLNPSTPVPLIMANIYAEVLVSLHQYFTQATSLNGFLILSGITQEKEEFVSKTFLSKHWVKRARSHTPPSEDNSPGWISLLLERTY